MTALAVFLLTYALIAGRRLRALPIGRPAGAMLGAALMVGLGVLSPAESFAAVDLDTLLLLFGMMLVNAFVAEAGAFDWMSRWLLARCRSGPGLLVTVGASAAAASALLLNDTVCLFLTPVAVSVCAAARLPLAPFLVAIATSANLGSIATPVGNPQNMLVARMGGLGFAEFAGAAAPVAAGAVSLNLGLLWLVYRKRLAGARVVGEAPPAPTARQRRVLVVLALLLLAFLGGAHLGYAALGAGVLLILLERRDPAAVFRQVDWSLLVFFAALFVVVAGLETTGLVARVWEEAAPGLRLDEGAGAARFTLLVAGGSNLVSNVPMALLVGPMLEGAAPRVWVLLSFVLTAAGNATLVGSMANLIVAEAARAHHELGFWEYLRFGLPSTALVLLVGVPWVLWG
jgi:Na+/H+ antiporter NhaD/arsenite permease-like protein